MRVFVLFTITCFCKPAGVPSGTCGGPGRPIGVPVMGIPHCGAPAIMFGGTGFGAKPEVGMPVGMLPIPESP